MQSISRHIAALAFGAALATAGSALARPSVINVQLSEYKIEPMQLSLEHDQAYVLHLTNTGGKPHNFSAWGFFRTVSLAPRSASKVENGRVDLDVGESADIALIPQRPGVFQVHCSRLFHSMLGMRAQIVVR